MGATAVIGAGAMLGQGAANYFGSKQQAQARQQQGQYQQMMYNENAQLADMQADDAIQRGDRAAAQVTGKVRQVQGSQRASAAAQGIVADTGSAAQLTQDSASLGALDALTIKNNAHREAWGYEVQAENSRAQGDLAAMGAQSDANNTMLTGGMNFVSAGVKAYGTYTGGY